MLAYYKFSFRFVCLFRKLKLWHGENARAITEFSSHSAPLSCVAITSEGELIASGDRKGNIFLWKLEDPDWKLELESELTEPITELQFVYRYASVLIFSNYLTIIGKYYTQFKFQFISIRNMKLHFCLFGSQIDLTLYTLRQV